MQAELEVPVSSGCRMVVDTSDLIGSVLAISGTWEPHVTATFRALLSLGDVCIDVGANIGYFALLASRLVGPQGRVYALEPAPDVYKALCSNLERNSVTNVTPLCVAAGDADGQALLYLASSGRSSIRPPAGAGRAHAAAERQTTIRTQRLDSVVSASDLPRVRLVKIDVEGYEPEVVRGLERVFERGGRPVVILEVSPARNSEAAVAERASFCARHRLKTYQLVDEGLVSGREDVAPALIETTATATERHELLLVPEEIGVGPMILSSSR